jgi:hypothetical protein
MTLSRSAALILCAGGALLLGCSGDGPTAPSAPAAPSGLTVQVLPSGDIGVGWTDNSSDEAGFEIWRSPTGDPGTYTLLTTVAANATSANDTGLAPATEYCYQVRATGSGSAPPSAFTTSACATTLAPPAAPSNLAATATSATAIALAWTDNASDESGFEIWRSPTGNPGTYTLLKGAAANATSDNDTGLTAATQYCYQVRALRTGAPASTFSNSSCATTWTPVTAPSNLAATVASSTSIALSWTDNSSNETGFELWRSTTGPTGTYTLLTSPAANATSANDTGLTPGTQYCYQVRALGGGITPTSDFSSSSCATPVSVRVVLFGDSNTEQCTEDWTPTQLASRKSSYVSIVPRLLPTDPNLACSTPGKVEAKWQVLRPETIRAVNHAIISTSTGGNTSLAGDPDRSDKGSPNARFAVGGITRFEAEVLGQGYPWSGAEPTNANFPTGAISRVNAFTPGANDFVYVSMGTNDFTSTGHPERNLTAAQTAANLSWMADAWIAAGRAADHFIITTLPPRTDATSPTAVPDRNTAIRTLATAKGLHLIDLSAHVSGDDGVTWLPGFTIDGTAYNVSVRDWLADQIVAWMAAKTP